MTARIHRTLFLAATFSGVAAVAIYRIAIFVPAPVLNLSQFP